MKKGWYLFLLYGVTIATFLMLTQWVSNVTSAFVESSPIKRQFSILIDPGHGGEDGGAISCSGLPESGYNLEISLRLKDLMQFLGYDVKMTRDTDVSIHQYGTTIAQKKASDLKERVRLANTTKNAVLLSIHQNHFADERYSGAQVFYAGTTGSDKLARNLQESFTKTLNPTSNRQCKKCSGIYLMEHIQCTGVLIECGFLSNRQEEAKLRDAKYQKQLCSVITSTVSQFLSNT